MGSIVDRVMGGVGDTIDSVMGSATDLVESISPEEAAIMAAMVVGGQALAGGFGSGSAAAAGGTAGDIAASLQMANPALSVGEAMAAAESYAAAGFTAPQIAGMVGGTTGGMAETLAANGMTGGGAPFYVAPGSAMGGLAPTAGGITTSQMLVTGLNLAGGYLQGQQAKDAANTAANAQIEAARIAAESAKFKPVGVTTRFGTSQFGYDKQGNLTGAGYILSPELRSQQDTLMGMTPGLLQQYQGAQAATAPLGAGAQQAMQLGQGYLGADPRAQAAQYMAEQQALLAPSREAEFAGIQERLNAQGRGGLAIGGGASGMMAANPELNAYYNAKRLQDLQLAAQATQGGMDYAKFGAGMLGTGADLQKGMYDTQTAAYTPYQTSLGGAAYLEGLGQQPMDMGINIGAKGTAASAQSGMLMGQGMSNAGNIMQPANAWSPWADLLSGAGSMMSNKNPWGK